MGSAFAVDAICTEFEEIDFDNLSNSGTSLKKEDDIMMIIYYVNLGHLVSLLFSNLFNKQLVPLQCYCLKRVLRIVVDCVVLQLKILAFDKTSCF